jgi:hypothetical protein
MFCIVAKFIGHVKKVLPLLSIDLSSCCWIIVSQCILPIICTIGSNNQVNIVLNLFAKSLHDPSV